MRPQLLAVLATLSAPAATGVALAAASPPVTISGAWLRLLTPAIPAGGYFTLRNDGSSRLVLTGARSPGCGSLMLHQSTENGGMSAMRMVQNLPVPPKGTLTFAPGGYHLMCLQPSPDLHPGASVPFTLEFAGGASARAVFDVRGAAGR